MAYVGFSTDNFLDSEFSLNERIKFFASLGNGDALELFFETPEELENYELTIEIIKLINKYKYVTLHAPTTKVEYGLNAQTKKMLKKFTYLCEKLSVKGIVIHPHSIVNFSILEKSELPFLLENMDSRKDTGTHPHHFEEYIKKYNFNFVFDVEHAYEHDPSMEMSKKMIKIMGNRLQHMHVSGSNKQYQHYPTFMADTKENISKILELKIPVPKLLEGMFTKDIKKTAISELKFIQSFEKKI